MRGKNFKTNPALSCLAAVIEISFNGVKESYMK